MGDVLEAIGAVLFIAIIVIFTFSVYFLPAIIAGTRDHHNMVPIFLLNLFLGWSLLGWVAALVWSTTKVDRTEE